MEYSHTLHYIFIGSFDKIESDRHSESSVYHRMAYVFIGKVHL